MNKLCTSLVTIILLSGCNSVYMKPKTLDKNAVFYVDAGGFLMQQGVKETMERRGYNLTVGHKKASASTTYITAEGTESKISEAAIGTAKYVVHIAESTNKFYPVWCSLNGFWWTRFNISIADNITGQELLHWTGRGCTNSSVRLFDKILDDMEK